MDFTYFCQTLLNNDYEPCPSKFRWAARKKDLVFVGLGSDHIKVSVQGFQDFIFHFSIDDSVVYGFEYPRVRAPKYPLLWFLNYLVEVLISGCQAQITARLNELDKGIEVKQLTLEDVQKYVVQYANHYSIKETRLLTKPDPSTLEFTILNFGGMNLIKVHQTGTNLMFEYEYTTMKSASWRSITSSSNNINYATLAKIICYLNWEKWVTFSSWISMPRKAYGIPEVNPTNETPENEVPEVRSTAVPPEGDSVPKVYDAQAAKAKAAEIRCAMILESIQSNSEKGLFYLQLDSIGAFNNEVHQEIEKRLSSLGYSIFRSNGRYVVTW